MTKIMVVVGTVREGRVGRKIADWYIKKATQKFTDVKFELFDLAEENLPIFNEPLSPMMNQYSDNQKQLANKISSADGFVIVTGEYNHSVPGSLKNFIDYLYAEWNNKPVSFVGYGSLGGVRSIEHLIQIMVELKAVPLASSGDNVHITQIWQALDQNGEPNSDQVKGDITKQLERLLRMSQILSQLR